MHSPPLVVTFLGTGTSTGVPLIACDCSVCHSKDPRDKRLRPSIIVTIPAPDGTVKRILVDTTPDMRTQMLRAGIDKIDAVIITHTHADHIFGMDDIRQFNYRHGVSMPIYGTADTLAHLREVFSYCFKETQMGGGKPQLDLMKIHPYQPFDLCGVTVTPLLIWHGTMPILGLKFGTRFAYVTDASSIPDQTRPYLQDLDALTLNAVRYEPHPTHFSLSQALEQFAHLAPAQGYLTHLSHYFLHEKVSAELPPKVALAYDGLTFEVPAGESTP